MSTSKHHNVEGSSFDFSVNPYVLEGANIVLLGPPGSGKTSLARLLCSQTANLTYISLGDIARSLPEDDPFKQELNTLYVRNEPSGRPELFTNILKPKIAEVVEHGSGFILDGMPKKSEEIEPLTSMLRELGVTLDAMLVCSIDPLKALKRVSARRDKRESRENLETALNRTLRYYEDLESFYSHLGGYLGNRVVTVDTERYQPEQAAELFKTEFHNLRSARSKQKVTDHEKIDAPLISKLERVAESIDMSDNEASRALIDLLVGANNSTLDFESIFNGDINLPVERIELIESWLCKSYPEMKFTPRSRKRYAEQINESVIESVNHVLKSVREEVTLRVNKGADKRATTIQVLQEVSRAGRIISDYQQQYGRLPFFADVVHKEIKSNKNDLQAIESFLQEAGEMPEGVSIEELFKLQPELWHVLTSNQIIVTEDFNYRKLANSIPGSHHSLAPPIVPPRSFLASPIGDYRPFVEAVSVDNKAGFYTTFGFLHTVGHDSEGLSYQVEFPVLMIDESLALHTNELLQSMLNRTRRMYFNHDLWHNLLPVYAEHFRLQHPLSPISQGGEKQSYLNFGRSMRTEKEDYEIGVAMAHARTQQDRLLTDDVYLKEQLTIIDSIVAELPDLHAQLSLSDSGEFADRTANYLCSVVAGRILNVLPPDNQYIGDIDKMLRKLEMPKQVVSKKDVLQLLLTQSMILVSADHKRDFLLEMRRLGLANKPNRVDVIDKILPLLRDEFSALPRDLHSLFLEDPELVGLALKYISIDNEISESGSQALFEALYDIGIMDLIEDVETIELDGMNKVRWLAIIAPQREQLKGHIEKVHGKKGVKFGDEDDVDPRFLLKKQFGAIKKDSVEYGYRKWARRQNEMLSMNIYDLLFNDKQLNFREERELLSILLMYEENSGNGTVGPISSGVKALDAMLCDLVIADYDAVDEHVESLEKLAIHVADYAPALREKIEIIINDYLLLSTQEKSYLKTNNKTYVQARKEYEDALMTLVE